MLAEEYVAASMASDVEDGRMAAADDLLAIENIFEQIGEMFDRINIVTELHESRETLVAEKCARSGFIVPTPNFEAPIEISRSRAAHAVKKTAEIVDDQLSERDSSVIVLVDQDAALCGPFVKY